MKTLIITEKPSVARDFAKALDIRQKKEGYLEGDQYLITWAIGHLVTLLEPEDYDPKWKQWRMNTLPILPHPFRYKPIPDTRKQLEVIKKLLALKPQTLIIATDAGREGEAIARSILEYLKFKQHGRVLRFWTSQALTRQVILDGLSQLKPASEYDRLWRAGKSRQIGDWLVGMNCSRAATIKLKDLFSIGRVQTAVLALLVDRRRERERFQPEPYWLLKAVFINDAGVWPGTWFKKDISRFTAKAEAEAVQALIAGKTGAVLSVKKQEKSQPPPLLYSLTDLQQDANIKFGFSAKMTLNIAQALYESKKCLSYPRTDARVLGTKNVDLAKAIINELSAVYPACFSGVMPSRIDLANKRVFNDAGLTDHHALIPLNRLPAGADSNETRIYELVLKRFAAAFHPDFKFEQTEIITEVAAQTFQTHGKRTLKPGWKAVYGSAEADLKPKDEEIAAEQLPPLKTGDPAAVQESRIEEKKTTPPPAYTEALLLKDMSNPGKYVVEDELKRIYRGETGLGTQATRAQIIEILISRKYVDRTGKQLTATDKGCLLIEKLRGLKVSGKLASPTETARWEKQLDAIARGKDSEDGFLNDIKQFVAQAVNEFNTTQMDINMTQEIGTCPACGGNIIEGNKGFGCANWKTENGGCRFVIWKNIMGKEIALPLAMELLKNKQAGPLPGFNSPTGKAFSGKLQIVNQDGAWQVQVTPQTEKPAGSGVGAESDIGVCPACGGNIIESNKAFGCENWREQDGGCRFAVWKTVAQKSISKETAIQILQKGISDPIIGFISKKGSQFTARLKLEKDVEGKYRVSFDFLS